jgi:hypothetical protein
VNFQIGAGSVLVANGTLTLQDGTINGFGTLDARGPVTVSADFDGGSTSFRIGGTADQTYSNAGNVNMAGVWTVDKSAGSLVLLTDVDRSNDGAAALNLTNGTITTGDSVVNAGTRVVNHTNGFVNGKLQRSFTSTGIRVFPFGTDSGFSPVSVNVTTLGQNPSQLRVGAAGGR